MRWTLLLLCCIVAALNAAAQNTSAWTLVWSDEFNQPDGSPPDSAKWNYDIGAGGWGNGELEYYTSRTNNARIENGNLVIEALQENFLGSSYTSARIKTMDKASWTYARFEARMKLPRGQGLWPSFWLLGANYVNVGWPACGEMDIMENIGREPDINLGAMHGPGYSGSGYIGRRYTLPSGAFADDFHVFALEWTTNQIKWFVDGLEYSSATPGILPSGGAWVFTQPQSIFLNVAVGGTYPGNPDGSTTFPQRLTVDYVRVFAPTNLPTCTPNARGIL